MLDFVGERRGQSPQKASFLFQRNYGLLFHVDGLSSRRITFNVKTSFL